MRGCRATCYMHLGFLSAGRLITPWCVVSVVGLRLWLLDSVGCQVRVLCYVMCTLEAVGVFWDHCGIIWHGPMSEDAIHSPSVCGSGHTSEECCATCNGLLRVLCSVCIFVYLYVHFYHCLSRMCLCFSPVGPSLTFGGFVRTQSCDATRRSRRKYMGE